MKRTVLICTAMIAVSISAMAQNVQPVDENGLAIGGYDVVAYFSNETQRGMEVFSAEYNGVTYHFSSRANMKAFKKKPQKYLPQFDGYCAWGMAVKGSKFPVNPEAFDIVDGKLYLFFNGPNGGRRFNASLLWWQETSKLMADAHINWVTVSGE